MQADGSTFSQAVDCNGKNSTIISQRSCLVPAGVLHAAPYNLLWGASVTAKIATVNIIGTSPFSSVGNGAVLINGPSAP